MIALNSARSLEILLGGAVTTNQLPFTATYADHDPSVPSFTSTPTDGQTNNTTAVTVVSAPTGAVQRTIKRINVYNADTAQATVTIRLNNGGTLRTMLTVTLQTGERIEYEDAEGFRVFTVTGAVKVTAVTSTVEPGYIDGMTMLWVSGTSLTISSGSAYIPSVGANVNVNAPINKAGLALSPNTWYHVYLFLNAGIPDFEIENTAPSAPYNGSARTKSGDTTRRYIGSVRSNGSSQLHRIYHTPSGLVKYAQDVNLTQVLSGGMAATTTTVSAAAFVPVTSQVADIFAEVGSGDLGILSNPDIGTPASANILFFLRSSQQLTGWLVLSTVQTFTYMLAPAVTGMSVWVSGYHYER